jgi:hypothetical protein
VPAVTWKIWWPSGLLLVASCTQNTPCYPGSADIWVVVPGGVNAIASIEVTGACAQGTGQCIPLMASCETASCDCEFLVQVNQTTFGSAQTEVCHVRVTSKSRAVLSKDFTFTSTGASCFAVTGPTGRVAGQFSDAGIADGDVGNADAAD